VTPEEIAETPPPKPSPPQETINPNKLDLRLSIPEKQQVEKPSAIPSTQAALPAGTTQQSTTQPEAPQPAYATPVPDLSLRYQVDLGLKALAAAPALEPLHNGTSDFDDSAVSKAAIDASGVAAFRKHLKACGALPAAIQPGDKVVIVLRATFTPDGRLANAPALIEASASTKGPALMQAAVAALQKCQPHSSLPADKFAEWRVLDLRFTPQDFNGG
jgi:hypothetical protein